MTTNTEKSYPIKIKAKTYFALKKMGLMGETFDDVIQRVMGLHKLIEKKAKQKQRRTNRNRLYAHDEQRINM